jgi:tRNA-2-methylthio-N6-dimethylallyladenosine synthase
VAAKTMADDVPEEEKERRRKRLDLLQQSICADINERMVGRTVEVLVDGRDGTRWRGRTRTHKLVFFEDPRPLEGRLVEVAVEWAGPWSLVGRPADRARSTTETIALMPA